MTRSLASSESSSLLRARSGSSFSTAAPSAGRPESASARASHPVTDRMAGLRQTHGLQQFQRLVQRGRSSRESRPVTSCMVSESGSSACASRV